MDRAAGQRGLEQPSPQPAGLRSQPSLANRKAPRPHFRMAVTSAVMVMRASEHGARQGERQREGPTGQGAHPQQRPGCQQKLLLPPEDGVLLVEVRAGAEGDEAGRGGQGVRKSPAAFPTQPAGPPRLLGTH